MLVSFIRLSQTCQALGCGKTTLYKRVSEGIFPPPVHYGDRISAWPLHEVKAVCEAILKGESEESLRNLVADLVRMRSSPDSVSEFITQQSNRTPQL